MMETLEEEWKRLKPLILDYECIFIIGMKLLLWENNQEMNAVWNSVEFNSSHFVRENNNGWLRFIAIIIMFYCYYYCCY